LVNKKRYQSIWKKKNKQKVNAGGLIRGQVKNKKIPSPKSLKCSYCGTEAREYHHPNYSIPDFALPVCKKCHVDIHRLFTRGVNQ